LAFVHPSKEKDAEPFFTRYHLADLPRISDPGCDSYRAFKLERMRASDFLKPKAVWRAFQATVLKKHGVGPISGDEFQLPGVFLLYRGQIQKSYFYQQPWEHPDFLDLANASL
jgi:hypothetical protein